MAEKYLVTLVSSGFPAHQIYLDRYFNNNSTQNIYCEGDFKEVNVVSNELM